MINHDLVAANSTCYSERFGFDLLADPFPWFLLSILFGARISESIALRTFFLFKSEGVITPAAIIEAGFDRIVSILDSGGYARYDFRTATKLEEMSRNLISSGGLQKIHDEAEDFDHLVASLKALAKGIGDVTVGIFMREMVGVWSKAEPYPSEAIMKAAEYAGIDIGRACEKYSVTYSELESFLLKVYRECVRRKGKKSGLCAVLSS